MITILADKLNKEELIIVNNWIEEIKKETRKEERERVLQECKKIVFRYRDYEKGVNTDYLLDMICDFKRCHG